MKILAVQSRMGIGDTVIFLPFIKALSKKFNSPISILVKENSKANQYLHQTKYIDKILILERDNKKNNRHGGFFGIFKLSTKPPKSETFKSCKSIVNFLDPSTTESSIMTSGAVKFGSETMISSIAKVLEND